MWNVHLFLNKTSNYDADCIINGIKVEIKRDSDEIVAFNIPLTDTRKAEEKAREVSNLFLNYLAVSHKLFFEIKNSGASFENIDSQGNKKIVIGDVVAISNISIGPPTILSDNTTGKTIISDPRLIGTIALSKYPEATGYWRKAYFSDDTFDKFRNLYLTAENVGTELIKVNNVSVSGLMHQYSNKSKEYSILQYALNTAFPKGSPELNQLVSIAKDVPTFNPNNSVIEQVAKILYYDTRNQLNHAKINTDKKLPFNAEDERKVKTVLPLMEYVAESLLKIT